MQHLKKLSTKERLVEDAGLTLHERILKLKKEDGRVILKPFQLQVHFKTNNIKKKVIRDKYYKKPGDEERNNIRFLEIKEEVKKG